MTDFLLLFLQQPEIYPGLGLLITSLLAPGYCLAFQSVAGVQAVEIGVLTIHCCRWILAESLTYGFKIIVAS